MARIIYKKGYEPLSGIYAGVMYSTYKNGTCTAVLQRLPSQEEVEKNPSARAEWMVKTCVSEIQQRMGDKREAIKQYTNITHRVQRLYERFCELERDNKKLQAAILEAYYRDRRVLPSRKTKHPSIAFDGDSTDLVST